MGVLLTMFGARRACRKRGVAATCEATAPWAFRQLTMTFPERRADPKIVINTRRKHFQNRGFPHSAALVVGRQAAASKYTAGALPPHHSHGGGFLGAASAARPNFCRDP